MFVMVVIGWRRGTGNTHTVYRYTCYMWWTGKHTGEEVNVLCNSCTHHTVEGVCIDIYPLVLLEHLQAYCNHQWKGCTCLHKLQEFLQLDLLNQKEGNQQMMGDSLSDR